MRVSSPSADFFADSGGYTGTVLVGDSGAEVVRQVGLPLYPVPAAVAAACSQGTALRDPSHLWGKVTGTWPTVTAKNENEKLSSKKFLDCKF